VSANDTPDVRADRIAAVLNVYADAAEPGTQEALKTAQQAGAAADAAWAALTPRERAVVNAHLARADADAGPGNAARYRDLVREAASAYAPTPVADDRPLTTLDGATEAPGEFATARTLGEFAARWNGLSDEDRQKVVDAVTENAKDAAVCFTQNHVHRLDRARERAWFAADLDDLADGLDGGPREITVDGSVVEELRRAAALLDERRAAASDRKATAGPALPTPPPLAGADRELLLHLLADRAAQVQRP
jgi:hypothetical protein